jgi:hypothetical protein
VAIQYKGRYVESTTKTHRLTTKFFNGRTLVTEGNLGECEVFRQMGIDNNAHLISSSVIEEIKEE